MKLRSHRHIDAPRPRLRQLARCALWAVAVAVVAGVVPAAAQGRLDAQYEASLAGIPVGRGTWQIEIGDDQFTAQAKGGTTGLFQTFAGGSGTGISQGRVVNGALIPSTYNSTSSSSKKNESIRMSLANGNVKDFAIEPEPPVDADRIPVTDAHRRGVIDPMTGSLLRVPGTADPMSPEACRANTAVFDARMRFDLKLDYKRMANVKADKGYQGPALVCSITFAPIAGYIPDRPAIKYLVTQRNMEVWLVPIPGTRVLVPFRVTIPTPLGMAMLEATQFVTSAIAPRAAARTQ